MIKCNYQEGQKNCENYIADPRYGGRCIFETFKGHRCMVDAIYRLSRFSPCLIRKIISGEHLRDDLWCV